MLSFLQTLFIAWLVLEIDMDSPLPKPKATAKLLKEQAMRSIQNWHDKFSETYKKLALGYNYLKNCEKVFAVGSSLLETL